MNRRSFLKIFGLGIASLAVPAKLLAIEIKKKFVPRKIKPVGKCRQEKKLVGTERFWKGKNGEYIRTYGGYNTQKVVNKEKII